MSHKNPSGTLQERLFTERADRRLFQEATDRGFDYLQTLEERPVVPTDTAIGNLAYFTGDLPEDGSAAREIIEVLDLYGAPTTVASNGGRYFGFVTGAALPAATAVSQLAAFWDQNAAMQVMSPLAAKLEQVSEHWLKQALGLPNSVVAGFVSGTSVANLCALAAARYRILHNMGWDIAANGLFGAPRIRVVCGDHVHASVQKALQILGFGTSMLERVPVDNQGRMIPGAIPPLDERTILLLQAGNVNSGAFDPFEEILPKAIPSGCWVHIDGAFGLWAAVSHRLSHLCKGMEAAHSWAVDGHKTLNTPYDSGVVLCADSEALTAAMRSSGAYLVQGTERDGMAYTPEMSRRARAIEFWASLKSLGRSGLDELVTTLHSHAVKLANELSQLPGIAILNDIHFNQILIAMPDDEATQQLMQHLQGSGECWAGGSSWFGRKVIRVSVCAWTTTSEDVDRTVAAFQKASDAVLQKQDKFGVKF